MNTKLTIRLLDMCLNGNTAYFKDIISRGAAVSGIMIHKACLGGHKDVVQLFLESTLISAPRSMSNLTIAL
jgi:hypothetical protein